MRNRQQGMTFLGLCILIVFIGIFVYAGIRLTPTYLEYFKIQKALMDLRQEVSGAPSPQAIQVALGKRFDIEDITEVDPKTMDITHDEKAFYVHATYDVTVPFVGNVSFLVHFDKTVTLPIQ